VGAAQRTGQRAHAAVLGIVIRPPAALAPPNVESLGLQRDLDPVHRAASILIRVPPHDSLSAMVLEALAWGREVIYFRPFPYTRQAGDEEEAAEALARHLAEYCLNEAGARHVAENFSPDREAARLARPSPAPCQCQVQPLGHRGQTR
jgi:hypothetical protein